MALLLAACGPVGSLLGNWVPKHSEDPCQAGYITEDTIEIYWISDGGETVALYWSGSYEELKEAVTSYSWDSVNDSSKTDGQLLVSDDDVKTFTYENGGLSYSVTVSDVTATYELVMTDEDYLTGIGTASGGEGTLGSAWEIECITIFFDEGTTQEHILEIQSEINSWDEVSYTEYTSAEQAWEEYKEKYFSDYPELAQGFGDENPLEDSASVDIYTTGMVQIQAVAEKLYELDYVRLVNIPEIAIS